MDGGISFWIYENYTSIILLFIISCYNRLWLAVSRFYLYFKSGWMRIGQPWISWTLPFKCYLSLPHNYELAADSSQINIHNAVVAPQVSLLFSILNVAAKFILHSSVTVFSIGYKLIYWYEWSKNIAACGIHTLQLYFLYIFLNAFETLLINKLKVF